MRRLYLLSKSWTSERSPRKVIDAQKTTMETEHGCLEEMLITETETVILSSHLMGFENAFTCQVQKFSGKASGESLFFSKDNKGISLTKPPFGVRSCVRSLYFDQTSSAHEALPGQATASPEETVIVASSVESCMVLGDQKAQLLGDFFPFPGQKKQRFIRYPILVLEAPICKKNMRQIKSDHWNTPGNISSRKWLVWGRFFLLKPCRLSDSSMDRLIGDVPQASI